ncbi:MAG: Gfo/Idh/MocA family oxidoreductase [Rhodobacteraceae bacterium]|nr:Gfo/Idh/MocA family oxidoreductase [Paracoccaceae bacterium]
MGKQKIRVGLIGSGFMGMTHAFGYVTAARVFDLPVEIQLECVADATPELARAAAERFGFHRAVENWRDIVEDSAIDLLDITAPNRFHKEMALAGIAAGKHVYCEKPLATNSRDAEEMADAAEAAGVVTQVGFNYLANPMLKLALSMISDGLLGEIRRFRGIHAEDYMVNADAPWSWRLESEGGGAFADLGSHVLATAEFLLGPVDRLFGSLTNSVSHRNGPDGMPIPIEVDDGGHALLRFAGGATGIAEANWIATGQKMQHDFEIYGSRGALTFSQERLNELRFYDAAEPGRTRGFRTILAAPGHEPYGNFCVAPGHQLGFNDLKAIEIAEFIKAIAGRQPAPFSFRKGAGIQSLVDLVRKSSDSMSWLDVPS